MPDIAMCTDSACPLASKCYRFRAVPSEFRQSWFAGDIDGDGNCNHYWPVEPGMRVLPFDIAAEGLGCEPMERRA